MESPPRKIIRSRDPRADSRRRGLAESGGIGPMSGSGNRSSSSVAIREAEHFPFGRGCRPTLA